MSASLSRFVQAPDVTTAWISGVQVLRQLPKFEAFNLVVRIDDPIAEIHSKRAIIDGYLSRNHPKWQNEHIDTVAETIFPVSYLHTTCPDPRTPKNRQAFYRKYMGNSETIRAFNPIGTYFQRIINWPGWDSSELEIVNQLEIIINKINSGKAGRSVYEIGLDINSTECVMDARIYNPLQDRKHMQIGGFPCLSHLSIKPEQSKRETGRIHMAALYRNHYFIEKAYGNYLGLGLLLKFIADATNRSIGELVCVSSLAGIDELSGKRVDGLLELLE